MKRIHKRYRHRTGLRLPRYFPIVSLVLTVLLATVTVSVSALLSTAKVRADAVNSTDFVTTWKTDVDSAGDSTITIPTVGIGYNYSVDWNNDGTYDQTGLTGSVTHDFGTPGTYTIRIHGDFPRINFGGSTASNQHKIIDINQWGDITWTNFYRAFYGAVNLKSSATDAPDLSLVTNTNGAFMGDTVFNGDLSGWDMSHVTNMSNMFNGASAFNSDISAWDTSKVTDMSYAFSHAHVFNQPLNNWDTSQVTNMTFMFCGAIRFNQGLSGWDVSRVTNMNHMFCGDTNSYGVVVPGVFNGDISTWDTSSVTNMQAMFADIPFNQDISGWDTSKVTNMMYMFSYDRVFNQDISSWNTSSVTDMSAMFYGAAAFNQDLSGWDTSSVTDMAQMFTGATQFNGDISTWDVSNVTSMSQMFEGLPYFNQDLSRWDTSNVTSMSMMFYSDVAFASDLSSWNTSSVTSMWYMFFNATSFDSDISSWDVSQVTDFSHMFYNARSFSYDLSAWDISPTADVTDMFAILPAQRIDVVAFSDNDGKKELDITGTSLVGAVDESEGLEAMARSLVSLNGIKLPFCAFGGMTAQQLFDIYGMTDSSLISDTPPCYYLSKDGVSIDITTTHAAVWLPDDFDTTAPGTVSVNGSPVFKFNQPASDDDSDDGTSGSTTGSTGSSTDSSGSSKSTGGQGKTPGSGDGVPSSGDLDAIETSANESDDDQVPTNTSDTSAQSATPSQPGDTDESTQPQRIPTWVWLGGGLAVVVFGLWWLGFILVRRRHD